MAGVKLFNLGLTQGWSDSEDGWGDAMNSNLRQLDTLVQGAVQDKDLSTPPAHVSGNNYIVKPAGADGWAGQDNNIAHSTGTAWVFYTAKEGMRVWVKDEDLMYSYNGSAWSPSLLHETGIINVKSYGAKGDGSTDDTTAINNAISTASAGDTVYFPPGTYLCVSVSAKSGVHMAGTATLLLKDVDDQAAAILNVTGSTTATTTTLTANIGEPNKVLSVTSSASFAAGDYVLLRDSTYKYGTSGRNQELNHIESVAAGQITLSRNVISTYTTAASAEVVKVNAMADMTISGLTFQAYIGGDAGGPIRAELCHNVTFKDVTCLYPRNIPAFYIKQSAGVLIDGCVVRWGQDKNLGGTGYGIYFEDSIFCLARNCYTEDVRENAIGVNTRYSGFVGCVDVGAYDDSWNTHGNGNEGCYILDCVSLGSRAAGILIGFSAAGGANHIDTDCIVDGCVVSRCGGIGIYAQGYDNTTRGARVRISNNHVSSFGSYGIWTQYTNDVTISGNQVEGGTSGGRGISIEDCSRTSVTNNTVTNITDATEGAYGIHWSNATSSLIADNRISGGSGNNLFAAGTNSVTLRNNVMDDGTVSLDGTEHVEHFNVRDFGATGDGSTNDTTAIQAAITAAAGGACFFPEGTYLITSSLTISANTRLFGVGRGSVISCATAAVHALSATSVAGVQIADLRLTLSSTDGDPIRFTSVTDSLIENVSTSGGLIGIRLTGAGSARNRIVGASVTGANQSGILVHTSVDCELSGCVSYSNGSATTDHGIYISDSTSRRCLVADCTCYSNAGSGIQLAGQHHVISGGAFYSNTTNGIVNNGATNCTIQGSMCQGNSGRGIYADVADYWVINGVQCLGNTLSGLEIKNARYVAVNGGRFSDNVRHGIWLNGSVSGEVAREIALTGCVCTDNDSGDTSTYSGISVDATAGTAARNAIVGCVSRSTTGTTKQIYGVLIGTGAAKNLVAGCQLYQNKTASLQNNGTDTITDGSNITA